MIGVAYPSLLIGGAVGACIAVLLHLLVPTPPGREALPTARFLSRDARTLLRLRKRPTDVPLLLIRIGFIAALAAGLAGLTWTGSRSGTARVVLLDAGADTLADWTTRIAQAQRLTLMEDETEPVLVAYGLETGYRVIDPAGLDRLVRGPDVASAQDGLRALRAVAADGPWARAEAIWLTRPAWRAWSPDLGLLRAEIWPGRVPLAEGPGPEPLSGGMEASAPTAWVFPEAIGTPLEGALRALGIVPLSGSDAGSNPEWIIAHDVSDDAADAFLDRAREGSSVVLSGRLPDTLTSLLWSVSEGEAGTSTAAASATGESAPSTSAVAASGVVLPWGIGPVGDRVPREAGAPAAGAHVVAVFEDALPAASTIALGRGCVTYLAADILDASLTASSDYPALVESLAAGCSTVTGDETPLDEGARFALERPDLPGNVEVASLGGGGVPLARWFLILALLFLLAEVGMTRGRAS